MAKDELFGTGIRPAHEDRLTTRPANKATMVRRLPHIVALVLRLSWSTDRTALASVVGCQLASGFFMAVNLLAVRDLFSGLMARGGGMGALLPTLGVIVGASMGNGLCTAVSTRSSGRLAPRVAHMAQSTLLDKVAHARLAAIEDPEVNDLVAAGRRGTDAVKRVIDGGVAICTGLVSVLTAGSVLVVLDPRLLPLLFLPMLPRAWASVSIAGRWHASMRRRQPLLRQLEMLARLLTTREAAEELRAHRIQRFLLGQHDRLSRESMAEEIDLAYREARVRMTASATAGGAMMLTYGLLVLLSAQGVISLAFAATAALAVRAATMSVSSLFVQGQALFEDALYVADWEEVCARSEELADGGGPRTVASAPATISAKALSFRYPNSDALVLNDIDFTIRRGEVVALVGANGSGKSTLVKLITGLYLPSGGTVEWDGVRTDELDRDTLRDHLALVAQKPVEWPFTASANVTVGRSQIPLDEGRRRSAAAATGADHVVDGLEDGWDSLLAKELWGGTNLSGGQWQRIGLARAWYRDASLMILDEPTSALDPQTEIDMFDHTMDLAGQGRMVVLVTHRLASLSRVDRIYVFDRGEIVEHGHHDELMRANGTYAHMYRLQAAQFANPGPGPGPTATLTPSTQFSATSGRRAANPGR
ncbi:MULTISPECIES: ABC transporter ATP-binding protein [unclassified Streptomyces]|uniref:ABC transporter ATP-binding protein n=1 Tax=unclassified Streptomyces TaxID=2593676 RepID=UPI003369E8D5